MLKGVKRRRETREVVKGEEAKMERKGVREGNSNQRRGGRKDVVGEGRSWKGAEMK